MNNGEKNLKYFIESKGNNALIESYLKENNITLNDFNKSINKYLVELKKEGKINKSYIEYCLKYNSTKTTKESKRKQTEKIINIINNYILENSHNIKDYVISYNLNYITFKKFINNSKQYYLTEKEKKSLKQFLKRETEFNEHNLNLVKEVVEKICDDLVNDKPYDILDYYKDLGWDSKLLTFYINNNNKIFSSFIRDNLLIYFEKYHIDNNMKKESELINLVKNRLYKEDINKVINFINNNKLPYNLELFNNIYKKYKNNTLVIE